MGDDKGNLRLIEDLCKRINIESNMIPEVSNEVVKLGFNAIDCVDPHLLRVSCLYLVVLNRGGLNGVSNSVDDFCSLTDTSLNDIMDASKLVLEQNDHWVENANVKGLPNMVENMKKCFGNMGSWFKKFKELWRLSGKKTSQNDDAFDSTWLLFVIARQGLNLGNSEFTPACWTCELLLGVVCAARLARDTPAIPIDPLRELTPDTKKRRIQTPTNRALRFCDLYKYLNDKHLADMKEIFMNSTLSKVRAHKETLEKFLEEHFSCGVYDLLGSPALGSFYTDKFVLNIGVLDEICFLRGEQNINVSGPSWETPQRVGEPSLDAMPPLPPKKTLILSIQSTPNPTAKKTLFSGGESPRIQCLAPTPEQQPLLSPTRTIRASIPETPITKALAASHWLERELQTAPNSPSGFLVRCCADCKENPLNSIVDRISCMVEKLRGISFLERSSARKLFVSLDPSRSVDECMELFDLAKRLNYRVLERILETERDKERDVKFDVILHNDAFHRSLFTCCLEVIVRAKERDRKNLRYPAILGHLAVRVTSILSIIDTFIECVPQMPELVKQHLADIEINILEQRIWNSNSDIFAAMKTGKFLQQEKMADKPTASPYDHLFKPKLNSLLKERVSGLLARLSNKLSVVLKEALEPDIGKIMSVVLKHHANDLMKDRHVDTMILCSIYGAAKAKNFPEQMTFTLLSQVYKEYNEDHKRSHYCDDLQVRKRILLDASTGVYGDLVKFYNIVFIGAMKDTILDLRLRYDRIPPVADRHLLDNSISSPQVTGSPARPPRIIRTEMTPRTRALYANNETIAPLPRRNQRGALGRDPLQDDDRNPMRRLRRPGNLRLGPQIPR